MPKIIPRKQEKLKQMEGILRDFPHMSIRRLAFLVGIPPTTAYRWRCWLEENGKVPSGRALLRWKAYSEPYFSHYAIYKSRSPDKLGELVEMIFKQSVNELEVKHLYLNTSYYFTIRTFDRYGNCYREVKIGPVIIEPKHSTKK